MCVYASVHVIALLYVLVGDTVETGETLMPSDWGNQVTIHIVNIILVISLSINPCATSILELCYICTYVHKYVCVI